MTNAELAQFVVGTGGTAPTLAAARRAALSGIVLERVPDHPNRRELHADTLRTLRRHLTFKAALRDLVSAWNEIGVTPLLFKGFYLAEFVYRSPTQRVYNDVDVYVDPEHVERACDAAVRVGWHVAWRADARSQHFTAQRGPNHGHEIAELHRQELNLSLKLDLHRRLVHNSHNRVRWHRVQSRLTDAAVRSAVATTWEGRDVRLLAPVDAIVYGLIINRCWSADAWQLKPRDYLDFDTLRTRFGLTREAIVERADELGVGRTLAIFLDRCDPYHDVFILERPGWRVRWWNLRVVRERGFHDLIRGAVATRDLTADAASAGLALLRTAPIAARAVRFARHRVHIARWIELHPVRSTSPTRVGRHRWRHFVRAIHRHQRLRGVEDGDRSTVAALAAFAWLRWRGLPAELVDIDEDRYTARLVLDGATLTPTLGASMNDE